MIGLDGFSSDEFPAPAPKRSGNVTLSTFHGSNPNGQWQLYVFDDGGPEDGDISNGWQLQITAKVKKKGKDKRH